MPAEADTSQDIQIKIPDSLPVLALRDIVIFPYMIVPLFVSRDRSIRAVERALNENRMILLAAQRDATVEEPSGSDLYQIGTAAMIMRMLKLPDNRVRVLVQGVSRVRITRFVEGQPWLQASVEPIVEPDVTASVEVEALARNVRGELEQAIALGKPISPEVMTIVVNVDEPGRLADLAASNLELKVDEAQSVLERVDPLERLTRIDELLRAEIELLTVQQQIHSVARGEIDRSQREFYLRQQLKAIQVELGEGNELAEEIATYRERVEASGMPEETKQEVERQIRKLERMHPDAAEATTMRNYLDVVTQLPWAKVSEESLDLANARRVLDEDHYGLEKIKDRIVEALAVRKLKPDARGTILCLVGPPGVGKTSLGRSIARATNREFQRLSLGGLHDEAEIRGHRRTYIGAMPGRIIQAVQQAGTRNPLMILDEIDKVGADFRGDPAAALLEVLDPEQNFTFRDNYLGVPFDLSQVWFMTTANMLDTIQPALLDRMEIIRLAGYTELEKREIARRHLIPRQMELTGVTDRHLSISDRALASLIDRYTEEAGLRQLEREIGKICRKVARRVAEGMDAGKRAKRVAVTPQNLHELLGPPRPRNEGVLPRDEVGVVTGLAWTAAGGEVLYIEALLFKGKGNLHLTGQLGDVMRESAQAAFSYARAHAAEFGIPDQAFEENDIHVHVPEGAVPKDGPSAGITMATAIISALSRRAARRDVAMTGEITLRGHVLAIGGVKEKVLAAHRERRKRVILPAANRRDLDDVPPEVRDELEFHFAETLADVLDVALRKAPGAGRQAAGKKAV
jgi:ATP-dependent Lon protease